MVTITDEVKVIEVGNSLRVAIPAVFCKALRILERRHGSLGDYGPPNSTEQAETSETGRFKKEG